MWPLDLSLFALAALILYLILTQLRFDDPRWQYNGWTYIAAIPLAAIGLDLLLRRLASRYVQKSIQIGFLSSIIVHLLLLIVAFQWVIFPHYFSETHTGVKSQPSPVQKTVPEYLFRTAESPGQSPDWSEPVAAAAPSRSAEAPSRQLESTERSVPERQLPQPAEPERPGRRENLQRRPLEAPAPPRVTDAVPASRQRQRRDAARDVPSSATPEAPSVAAASPTPRAEPAPSERSEPIERRTLPRTGGGAAAPAEPPESQRAAPPAALAERRRSDAVPTVGDPDAAGRPRPRAGGAAAAAPPAGTAPSAPSVAISRRAEDAPRMLAPDDSLLPRRRPAGGAEISAENLQQPPPASAGNPEGLPSPAAAERRRTAGGDQPQIAADAPNRRGRPRGARPAEPPTPAGTPESAERVAAATADDTARQPSEGQLPLRSDVTRLERGRAGGADLSGPEPPEEPTASQIAEAPGHLQRSAAASARGDLPELAAPPSEPRRRARRELGGPPSPAGTDVAAVEPFRRRMARTSGGAQPTPAGTVGPATEEAIERGLAWLADRQNDDGSWSLQGHGEEVVLTSDTAATGLSLLAFQGAGYTHRRHQYASTVARGLEYLIAHQRTNGDLYRRENRISDRNVALYSHGIAALAVCEAYGMTQDAQLRGPAQNAIDYIVATQHHQRGGWRYTPQVSADTSVTGWMMMALKSGELAGLDVPRETYEGIEHWLRLAQASPGNRDRYRYNPYAPDTPSQRHGRLPTPTMTSVGILMRMYLGWQRDNPAMQSAAEYLLKHPPQIGSERSPQRDTYYWYYATQVMFHMGGDHWDRWNRFLNPVLLNAQIKRGAEAGSWDPEDPVPDRWGPHAGRLYVTTMNLLNLEIYYRHLPIYEKTLE